MGSFDCKPSFRLASVNFPAISNFLLSSHSGKVALFDVFRFIQILLQANANITYLAHVNFWPFKRQPSGGPSR